MEILGVITARGGSKSIPKKSIAACAGRPLVSYTIDAARNSALISRLIISTDDMEMADIAKEQGVEVPFMRPEDLATDTTPDLPVFQHVLESLSKKEGYQPGAVIHLRPTTPLKKTADIDRGIELLLANERASSVRSVCEPAHTPFKMYRITDGYLQPILREAYPEAFKAYPEAFNMPRQILPTVWRHSGYVDVIRTSTIVDDASMSGMNILPLQFDAWRDIDIDSPRELEQAAYVVEQLQAKGVEPWM